jgi:hypothetical protein
VWDSAAFSSIFHASSFSYSQAESTPAHTQVTLTVGQPTSRNRVAFHSQVLFYRRVRKVRVKFLAAAFFKSGFESLFRKQVFKFSAFVQHNFFYSQSLGLVSSGRQNQRQGFSVKFWSTLVLKGWVGFFGKVRGRFCRLSKSVRLLSAKFRVS